jgi:MFS family permease
MLRSACARPDLGRVVGAHSCGWRGTLRLYPVGANTCVSWWVQRTSLLLAVSRHDQSAVVGGLFAAVPPPLPHKGTSMKIIVCWLRSEPMALEWISQVAPAVVAAGTAVFGLARGQGATRSSIRHDVETLKDLPTDSAAATALMKHIEWQIQNLHESETEGKRDLAMAVWGLFFGITFGYATIILLAQDWWWRWLGFVPFFFSIAMLYILVEALTVKKREPRRQRS